MPFCQKNFRLNGPKASSEWYLREHQGKWIETLTIRPNRLYATVCWLSGDGRYATSVFNGTNGLPKFNEDLLC